MHGNRHRAQFIAASRVQVGRRQQTKGNLHTASGRHKKGREGGRSAFSLRPSEGRERAAHNGQLADKKDFPSDKAVGQRL